MVRDNQYMTQLFSRQCNLGAPFIGRQVNITKRMREILVDWMMEVAEEFMIKRDTVYMAVDYLDRYIFLAEHEIPKIEL